MLPVTAVRWCLAVQCTDAVLFFPTLLLSVNPCAQRSPGEIKNKKPQPKTYLWTINWYRFLPISQWALCGLLRPPLIAGNPGLHYSVECLCLLCSWINAIAWENLGRWQTGASTLWITRCSRARLCPTLAVAAAFSSMCKGKGGKEQMRELLLKAKFAACWKRLAGCSAVVCDVLLGFDFSGHGRRLAVGCRNRWL